MFHYKRKIKKRGNLFDPIEAGVIVLSIVIILFIMHTVSSNFSDTIKANNATNISSVTSSMDSMNNNYAKGWDYGVLIMIIIFPIFSYIAARKIPTDSRIIVLTIFILVIIEIVLMIISNFYGRFMDTTTFATFIANPNIIFIPYIMPNLPYYGLLYMAVVLIGLYTKGEQ